MNTLQLATHELRLVSKMFPFILSDLQLVCPLHVTVEAHLVNPAHGDFDTIALLDVTDADGVKHPINRYFTECGAEKGQMREIGVEEYDALKGQVYPIKADRFLSDDRPFSVAYDYDIGSTSPDED